MTLSITAKFGGRSRSKSLTSSRILNENKSGKSQVSNLQHNIQPVVLFNGIIEYWNKDAQIDMIEIDSKVLNSSEQVFKCFNFSVGSSNSLKCKMVNQELNYPCFIEDLTCPKRKKEKIIEQVMVIFDNRHFQPTNLILSDTGHDMKIEALKDLGIPGDIEGAHAGTSVSKFPFGHHTTVMDHPLVQNLQIRDVAEDKDNTCFEDPKRMKIETGILLYAQDVYDMEIERINESGMVNDSNENFEDVERAPVESTVTEFFVETPSSVIDNPWIQTPVSFMKMKNPCLFL
ncbi:hypothetical protein LIER_34544 [Lithospermum erythrorhizon]|uniref:Polyprotein n=1 Tax=Lithospermum erythrorhizon TaxID=34254 RepID=A0AAV3S4A4_LITER